MMNKLVVPDPVELAICLQTLEACPYLSRAIHRFCLLVHALRSTVGEEGRMVYP